MTMRRSAVAGMMAAVVVPGALAEDIAPADSRGIRIIGAKGPLLLTFLAVKKTTTPLDDRTVCEFPLASVTSPPASAELVLGISDLDPGGPAGVIDVYVYEGDGVVAAPEFFAGTLTTSFECNSTGVFLVDVTPAVAAAVTGGWDYVGFRLSTVTADRYFLGSIVSQPEPLLRVETGCYADCNGVGGLTIADFACFQTQFVAGDPYADCNGTGGLTIADFACFQTKFVAGCP